MSKTLKSLILGCTVLCFTALSCVKHQGGKPVLNLYVMSHCPYGIRAEELILSFINDFNNEVTLHVRYIVSKQAGNSFASLHGPGELDEDLHQIALQELYGNKFYNYLLCYNGTMNRDKCLTAGNINKTEIDEFVKSGRSEKILDNDYKLTEKLDINASPTLYINDHRYNSEFQSEHIVRGICSDMPSLTYCKTLQPPVDVTVTVLTGGWKNIYHPELIKENLTGFFYKTNINVTDINTKPGKDIAEKYKIKEIPALLFSDNVTMTVNFNAIKPRLKDHGSDYIDYMNDLGYRHFIERPAKNNEMILLVNITDKEAVNTAISILRLLNDYKKSQYHPRINVIANSAGGHVDNGVLKAAAIIGNSERLSLHDMISMLTKLYTAHSLTEFNKTYRATPAGEEAARTEIEHNNTLASGLGTGQAAFALLINNTELIDAVNPAQSVGIFELSPIIGKQSLPSTGKPSGQCAK